MFSYANRLRAIDISNIIKSTNFKFLKFYYLFEKAQFENKQFEKAFLK